jgi:hypothetical protein
LYLTRKERIKLGGSRKVPVDSEYEGFSPFSMQARFGQIEGRLREAMTEQVPVDPGDPAPGAEAPHDGVQREDGERHPI